MEDFHIKKTIDFAVEPDEVGKTKNVIRKFASENFDIFLEINFEKIDQNNLFRNVTNVDDLIRRAEIITKKM